jgi:hypothetical protein
MYPSAGAGTSKASTAFWVVDDVAAEVAGLKARGVTFEEYDMPGIKTVNSIASGGGAKTALFKDTEGTSWRSALKGHLDPRDLAINREIVCNIVGPYEPTTDIHLAGSPEQGITDIAQLPDWVAFT